jgi:hypothetical protein
VSVANIALRSFGGGTVKTEKSATVYKTSPEVTNPPEDKQKHHRSDIHHFR